MTLCLGTFCPQSSSQQPLGPQTLCPWTLGLVLVTTLEPVVVAKGLAIMPDVG